MHGFSAIEWLARVGFVVKGVLYMVSAHWPSRSQLRQADSSRGRGALTTVLGQPFGRTLLLVVVVGLLGYAAWRILQGLFDPDRLGNNWRGLAIRASFAARGVLHAVLGRQAFGLYRGLSAASGTSERAVATEAFRWPLGDWLVVLAGLGLIGFAVQQMCAAITGRDWSAISMSKRCDARLASGRSASADSAWRHAPLSLRCSDGQSSSPGWFRDASEVGTTASSFRTLAAQPGGLGRWLLAVMAAGFVAYGFYEIIHARYLHIRRVR